MKKFQKIITKFLLGVMLVESIGLGNIIAYGQESQETGEKSTTEVVVTSDDVVASDNVITSSGVINTIESQSENDWQKDEAQNSETLEALNVATKEMEDVAAAVEIATRAAGESRAIVTSNMGDSRVVENVRITVETKNEDGSEKLEYLTGEPIKAFAGFTISDTNSEMRNTKLRLKIPKENVQIGTIGSFDVNTTNAVRSDTATEYVATWSFNRVIGGQLGDVPFTLNMIQPQTPDGFVVPVTVEFLDENDNVLKLTTKKFIAKTQVDFTAFKRFDPDRSSGRCWYYCATQNINGKQVIVKGITGLQEDNLVNTQDGNSAPFATYAIGLITKSVPYGMYVYDNVRIVEKLPAGAKMRGVPDAEGYYLQHGVKWRYDQDNHEAIFEWKFPSFWNNANQYEHRVFITLEFPNQPYEVVHENRASIVAAPNTTYEKVFNEVIARHKWNPEKIQPSGSLSYSKGVDKTRYYFNPTKSNTDESIVWHISVWNYFQSGDGWIKTVLKEVVDYNMDSRLYYDSISIVGSNKQRIIDENPFQILGILSSWQEELLWTQFDENYKFKINDISRKYQWVIIRFDNEVLLERESVYFHVHTYVRNDVWEKWRGMNEDESNLSQGFEFKTNFSNHSKVLVKLTSDKDFYWGQSSRTFNFERLPRNKVFFSTTDKMSIIYSGNNRRFITISPSTYYYDERKTSEDNYRIWSVFPMGITFKYLDRHKDCWVVDNWKNTGRQAVNCSISVWRDSRHDMLIDTSLYTNEGNSIIDHYLYWDWDNVEASSYASGDEIWTDVWDFDMDGDILEHFLHDTTTINFTPPRQIILKKLASIDGNNWFFDTPLADMGTDAFFKISIFNNSISDRNGNLTILDALPYVGDHKIVPEEDGSFLPRESVFAVNISQSLESIPENVEVLKKWSVLYTTDAQADSLESVRDANYVTADQIRDFRQVKSIKLVLNGTLAAGETNEFILKTRLPKNANLEHNSKVVNSTAFSYNNTEFAEGNFASIAVAKYKVSGKVFSDMNKDGNNLDGDIPLAGYVVTLVDADGNPVLDDRKRPITTTSKADGSYEFTVFNRGEYSVKITKKSPTEEITQKFAEIGTTGNDAEQDATTPKFSLTPENPNATRNFGFIVTKGSITLVKKNPNNEILSGVTFRLEKNGQKIGESKTTNNEGKIIFSDLELGEYFLIEESTLPAYRLDTTPTVVTINTTNPNITKEIINQYQNWKVKVIKKNPQWERLEGAEFELREGSATGRLIRTGRTNANGELSFDNVIYGNYILVEKTAPVGYIKGGDIAIWENNFTKNTTEIVQEVLNEKQLWNLVLTKKNPEWAVLAGAKFELRDQKGALVATKTSDQNGKLTFENLTYQNYSLVETEAPVGYAIMQPLSIPKETFVREKKDIEMDILNTKQKWNVKIIKTDDEDKALAGVEFELRKGTADGEVVATKTTPENGEIIFENLTYDSYLLIEKSAPMGYKILDPIAIGLDKFDKNLTEIVLPVKNEKQLWNIKILKVDSATKKSLSGAVFVLKDESGKEIAKQVSDSQGEVLFENITYVNYTISELTPPSGYTGKAEIKVTTENFDKNIHTLEFTAENTKIPVVNTPPSIPSGPGGCANCVPVQNPPLVVNTPLPPPETPKTPFTMSFTDIVEKGETEIKKFPKRMPRTGQMLDEIIYKKAGIVGQKLRRQLETSLQTEDFRLAGSTETSLDFWKQVLPEEDKNANKYIVIPSSGLVMPINTVEKNSRAYNNFVNGRNEDFTKYLETGAVDITGTSTRGFGEVGNKVIGGHSSYWKHSAGRYKTHFQKIIAMAEGQEIWVYEKNTETGKFARYVYRTTASYNTSEKDISTLKPTDHAALTLFTCTPIGGITGRWVVKSEFIGKFSAE